MAHTPAPFSASSALGSEKNARVPSLAQRRSCVVCRSRKVRCDRLSPCSNCRRANLACVFPSTDDRRPRWANRMERVANDAAADAQASQHLDPAAAQVMERLRNLESLVKELGGQLTTTASSATSGSPRIHLNSPESSSHGPDADHQDSVSPNTNAGNVQTRFGRLVVGDTNRSRYVSTGFWSRVNDELDGIKMDSRNLGTGESDTSEGEPLPGNPPSTQAPQRTPSERHAFLFGHNLTTTTPNLREFHPLPSQIPFFLDKFSENVNSMLRIVHVPTITKMIRNLPSGDMTNLTPVNEALMFSIYYSVITSMDDDTVMANFGAAKTDLNLKYRLGLEYALAKADFLNVPDLILVQAFAIFLCLARRHESPRFIWMMMGLLIRMAQALGLHRDGTHFKHLTPYEIEMRRRTWWIVCILDVRASEDQGTENTIARGSFDTKLPLNINDVDIEPGTTQMPAEREGITDMSLIRVLHQIGDVTKQMMTLSAQEGASSMAEQNRLLDEIYQTLDQGYLRYAVEPGDLIYWIGVTCVRVVMAKMTLLTHLPILFSSPSQHFSDQIKAKLLVAAIELAEYNHALHAEPAGRHWRWMWQTYTHWHAVVYLLIEISRRPFSPIVERAWVALHSQWLIPPQSHTDKNLRVWVPLRKLMAKARQHRDAEIERLRNDPEAAERLEMEDQSIPAPNSPGPSGTNAVDHFRERWRKLLAMPEKRSRETQTRGPGFAIPTAPSTYPSQPSTNPMPAYTPSGAGSSSNFDTISQSAGNFQTNQNLLGDALPHTQSGGITNSPNQFAAEGTAGPPAYSPSYDHWLWSQSDPSLDIFADVDVGGLDVSMDLDGEVDWYDWVQSAKGMELSTSFSGNGQAF